VRQLGNAIAARGVCLVVLDTFEHVRGLASSTLGRWLDRASEARFVVTSREVLGLAGENVLTLQPLGLDEARELFLIRAAQVKPGFTVREEERATVDELLQLLDGLPLAVELAAARVSLMPPSRLLSRMSDRFRLLASPQRSGRQVTLRATLDWSWDLLSPDERAALAQLTVFAGGFTLEAAEEVLELAELWPTDAVQALLDKSLLRRASVERYDLLASVAEYASERLDELGLRRAAEDRHGTHFAHAGGDDALASLDRHGGTGRRQALAAERANLVAACRRAVARGDGEVAVPTLRAAWAVLELRGPVELGLELAHAVAALPTLGSGPRARALEVRGKAGHAAGRREEAVAALERAVALAREAGEVRLEAAALRALGNAHRESGEDGEARRCFEDALVLARSVGDAGLEGIVLGGLAALDLGRGRSEAARANFERALGLAREVGDRSLEGAVLNNLGLLDGAQDRVDQAFQRLRAALEISREIGSQRVEGQELANLGVLHLGRGQLAEATRSFDAALAVVRQVGNRTSEGSVLANLGVVHQLQGRLDEAREHYDAAMVVLREVSDRRTEATVLANLGALHREQGRPAEAAGCLEEALVLQRSLGDSATEGITLGELAVLHLEQDRIVEARACVERAEPLVRATGDGQTLGKLLCARVRLERRAGHADAASIALAEAESCAHRVGRLLAQLR
jgi:predicted ATPase